MTDVHIVELPVDRWQEYRARRPTALRTDPIAFGSTYEESVAYPDEVWQSRLSEPTSIILFAEHRRRLVGMMGALLGADGEATVARIIAVFVEMEHRRRGVARLLLARFWRG